MTTELREIVFDVETTGISPLNGDRIVEIGCVELINHLPSGETFHVYINPECDIPAEATAIHGISNEDIKDKPVFAEISSDFMDFIGQHSKLIAHNAEFDFSFINAELRRLRLPKLDPLRMIDTLAIARRKYPGAPASLDALCRRFEIDNSSRVLHGALLDSEILAEVYLELIGGKQPGLELDATPSSQTNRNTQSSGRQAKGTPAAERTLRPPRPHAASAEELAAHQTFLAEKIKDALWLKSE